MPLLESRARPHVVGRCHPRAELCHTWKNSPLAALVATALVHMVVKHSEALLYEKVIEEALELAHIRVCGKLALSDWVNLRTA